MTAIAKSTKTHPAAKKNCGWEERKNLPYARWNNNPSRKGPIPYQLFHRVKQQIDKFFLFKIFEERLPEALGSVSEQIIIIWVKRSCNCFNKAN